MLVTKVSQIAISGGCLMGSWEGLVLGEGVAVPQGQLLVQLRRTCTSTNLAQSRLGFTGLLCLEGGLCLQPLYN